jgi:hypothetical protein
MDFIKSFGLNFACLDFVKFAKFSISFNEGLPLYLSLEIE